MLVLLDKQRTYPSDSGCSAEGRTGPLEWDRSTGSSPTAPTWARLEGPKIGRLKTMKFRTGLRVDASNAVANLDVVGAEVAERPERIVAGELRHADLGVGRVVLEAWRGDI